VKIATVNPYSAPPHPIVTTPYNRDKKDMNRLGEFFQDDKGIFSATRLAFLVWTFAVLIGWGVASARHNKLEEIPSSVQVIIGVLMTGKVVQKFGEQSTASVVAGNPASGQQQLTATAQSQPVSPTIAGVQ